MRHSCVIFTLGNFGLSRPQVYIKVMVVAKFNFVIFLCEASLNTATVVHQFYSSLMKGRSYPKFIWHATSKEHNTKSAKGKGYVI